MKGENKVHRTKIEQKFGGTNRPLKNKRFLAVLILVLLAVVTVAAGYILLSMQHDQISPIGGNVKITLEGTDYDLDEPVVPREVINVSPRIFNESNVDAYGFIRVVIPFYTVDGAVVEYYEMAPASGWKQVEREVGETSISYVFSYESSEGLTRIGPNERTDALFDTESALSVRPTGLLTEEQRTGENPIDFFAYGVSVKGNDGLSSSDVWNLIKEEGRGYERSA